MGKFIVKPVRTGYMFVLKARNSQIIATSEIYSSAGACEGGVESVRKCAAAPIEDQTQPGWEVLPNPKFEIYHDKRGWFRFRLKARNGAIIAASEGYRERASCYRGIESVRKKRRQFAG